MLQCDGCLAATQPVNTELYKLCLYTLIKVILALKMCSHTTGHCLGLS